jgi:tetratricopeptide (TPR) repeat protein
MVRSIGSVRTLSLLLILPLGISVSLKAQQQGGGGNSAPPGGAAPTGPGNPPNVGGRNTPNTYPDSSIYSRSPEFNRPIFLSGRVMMDDGSKPSSDVTIKRVCNGNAHTEAHTDSKGNFSFQVGANPMSMMDASDSSMPDTPGSRGRNSNSPFNPGGLGGRGVSQRDLIGCHIQAYYPGYRSDIVDLSTRHALDNPDIGIIVLHRLGNVQGTAISITSELAPKKAKKAYEKGMQSAAKGKTEEAEKHLQEAVGEYPKYALAWYNLGRIQASEHDTASARKSFEAAIAADSKYVSPYDGLALLATQENKWQEAADRSKQAVYLNPIEYPSSWFYNALANYNLQHPDLAEKSAKEVVKLDGAHKLPQAETLLAQIYAERGDYAAAAEHLQAYLTLQPNAPNSEHLRQQLAKLRAGLAERK